MILKVIIDISTDAIDRTFDYIGEDVPIGSRVSVSFGNKTKIGFVVDKSETTDFDTKKLKSAKLLDTPLDYNQVSLARYMIKMYNLRTIDVFRLFIPSKLRSEKNPQTTKIYLKPISASLDNALETIGNRSLKQREAFLYLYNKGGEFKTIISQQFGESTANSLIKKEVVEKVDCHKRAIPLDNFSIKQKTIKLTKEQEDAIDLINSNDGPFLIHGVTGSGKTEVYMNIIEQMLEKNKGTIMLVPEISLTPQVLGLFRARFGDLVSVLHSSLSDSERYDEWDRLKKGEAKIALGARSAIFAPINNLGLVIIDEEHDNSYISDNNPRYNTKEVATERCRLCNAKLILGSATPNIDSYLKTVTNEYQLISLPERVSKFKLDDIEIIDMLYEFRTGNHTPFSHKLLDEIEKTLLNKEQIMIFLNRRGYASYIRCPECGWVAKCSECDLSLTYHQKEERLKCHYCGKMYSIPSKCPKCGNAHIKHGRVGTEQIVSILQKKFPSAKILRLDMDTKISKNAYFNILDDFRNNKADILVGTQMIAKGHDFPNVTLVGILEGDATLYFSEYRASEITFQLLTQVAGRSGRADKKGKVLMQTYLPDHYVIRFAKKYDYEGFYKHEINIRETTKFPPYANLLRILISSTNDILAGSSIRKIYSDLKDLEAKTKSFIYIGMNRSPYKRLKGHFRYQIMIRLEPTLFENLRDNIYNIVNKYKQENITIFVELNPQDCR